MQRRGFLRLTSGLVLASVLPTVEELSATPRRFWPGWRAPLIDWSAEAVANERLADINRTERVIFSARETTRFATLRAIVPADGNCRNIRFERELAMNPGVWQAAPDVRGVQISSSIVSFNYGNLGPATFGFGDIYEGNWPSGQRTVVISDDGVQPLELPLFTATV